MIEVVFYSIAFLLLSAAVLVVSVRNPVHAVLFLIFSFFNAAALFIMMGAEYIAMTLVIVYVGAVAVLFLFVVMMIDVDYSNLKKGFLAALPIGIVLSGIVFCEINWAMQQSLEHMTTSNHELIIDSLTNTEAIGMQLYTKYSLPFQISGLVLLVGMLGAIVLTLSHEKKIKRQNVFEQLARTRKDSVEVQEVEFEKGIRLP